MKMTYDEKIASLFKLNFREGYRSARLLLDSHRRLKELIPLKAYAMKKLNSSELDQIDAFRVRFCDLQDCLGAKIFRTLLILEEEKPGSQLDTINKIEKRLIIPSFALWKELRDVRNLFSHEYPENDEDRAEAINLAYSHTPLLVTVLNHILQYAEQKIGISMDEYKLLSSAEDNGQA